MLRDAEGSSPKPAYPSIEDLPGEIRVQIPVIEVSTHIYSSDPTLRMARVNGQVRHESDEISEGLRLIEITELGILVDYKGYPFELKVLEDWAN